MRTYPLKPFSRPQHSGSASPASQLLRGVYRVFGAAPDLMLSCVILDTLTAVWRGHALAGMQTIW